MRHSNALRAVALLAFAACAAPPAAAPPASPPSPPPAPSASAPTPDLIPATIDAAVLPAVLSSLAASTLSRLPDDASEPALLDRALLTTAASDPSATLAALAHLRAVAKPADPGRVSVLNAPLELFARAKLAQAKGGPSFEAAFADAFRQLFGPLDDLTANHAAWFFVFDLDSAKRDLQVSLDRLHGKPAASLSQGDARELATRYARYATFRELLPLAKPLLAEDLTRRYDAQDVRIKVAGGATVSAFVVRPRRLVGPQPTVLFSTIYTDRAESQAYLAAAHGYVGVTSFTRGKRLNKDEIVPYEREAEDVPRVIDWIAAQPWSDGRVGMYGGSYCGFTQWAAAKHLPKALKTIVPYVAVIPGQGLPMENNVFLNVNYGWAFFVTDRLFDDDEVYRDPARWNALPDKWFTSGRPYREIDQVDGTPNPWLQRWLKHPSFDRYWQAMVPYAEDFARIDIPVLTVTGYFDDGQISALRYFTEHTKYRKGAEHYLLIGPYDHFGAQRRPPNVLRGYAIDPVARIDTPYVTFQWMDHVFRGGPMPALLADKVNYEVMGANEWRHAPSLEKAHDRLLTLYLDDHHLTPNKPGAPRSLAQQVDLADRKTSNNVYYPDPIVQDQLDDGHGVVFEGEPLAEPLEMSGVFTGEVRVRINKKDFDLGVELYEHTPDGKYVSLAYYVGRASYARDLTTRHLLTPGKTETIPFERTRMVSRQLAKGSRLVVVVNVNKNAFAQVNYGTGEDVSAESVADAGVPLQVEWWGDSFVRIPVRP